MTTPKQASATPILDLIQPLPEPHAERFNGRFAVPFLATVALMVITGNLSSLWIPLGFLLINFLTIAIHECGHVMAGRCVDLRFKAVRIDPIRISIDSGRWKFRVRPRLFRGFALMFFDGVRRVRHRLIVFIAGGPTASLLCGVCALVAGEIGLARYYDSPWPTFLEFFGAWSFLIGCISLIPFKIRGQANDGMLLRALLRWKPEAIQMIASYALSTRNCGLAFQPDYFRRWFRLAATPTKLHDNNYYTNWLAYEQAKDQEIAALFLERCLAASALMDEGQRDLLAVEATVFTAERRNDPAKADLWLKRIRSLNRLHPIWQARLKIALSCARQQFEDANTELRRALVLIRDAPDGVQRRSLETEWIAWGERIREQIPVGAV